VSALVKTFFYAFLISCIRFLVLTHLKFTF